MKIIQLFYAWNLENKLPIFNLINNTRRLIKSTLMQQI